MHSISLIRDLKLYSRMVGELLQSPEGKKTYAQQIRTLQELITEVTDKSVELRRMRHGIKQL